MNKKAFFNDFIMWMIAVLIFAILIVCLYLALSKTNDGFQSDSNIPSVSKNLLSSWTSRFKTTFDWFMVTIIVGIGIALIITVFMLRSSPIYMAIAILCLIILASFGYRFANIFYQFSSSSGIQPYSSQFNLLPMLMNNLPIFIIFMLVIFIIVLFGKGRGDSLL